VGKRADPPLGIPCASRLENRVDLLIQDFLPFLGWRRSDTRQQGRPGYLPDELQEFGLPGPPPQFTPNLVV
jgi:hypothetical protein